MDNQKLARLDILSEKLFDKAINCDELKEYLLLLDEWNVLDELDDLKQPTRDNSKN